jgi:hypothetical protein
VANRLGGVNVATATGSVAVAVQVARLQHRYDASLRAAADIPDCGGYRRASRASRLHDPQLVGSAIPHAFTIHSSSLKVGFGDPATGFVVFHVQ